MKTVNRMVYEAFDGAQFLVEQDCRQHEETNWIMQFVRLTKEQVIAALERKDTDLADAFERAGQRIAAARRESGELRRASPKRQDLPPGRHYDAPKGESMSDEEVELTIAGAECGE